MTDQSHLSPYEIARNRCGEIRGEIIRIEDEQIILLPRLKKELIGLETLIQIYGEVEEDKRNLSPEEKEAWERIQKRKQQDRMANARASRQSDREQEPHPLISSPPTLGETIHQKRHYKKRSPAAEGKSKSRITITDDAILAAAAFIEKNGPQKGATLYQHLLRAGLIEKPAGIQRPAVAFSLAISYSRQNLIQYDKKKQHFSLVEDKVLSQRDIQQLREKAVHNGSTNIDSRVSHIGSSNSYRSAPPAHGPTTEIDPETNLPHDRASLPFVLAVNVLFREQDNQPMGPKQIWEYLESEKTTNLTGCKALGEFTRKIEQFPDFFEYNREERTYHPVQPLGPDPLTLIRKTGERAFV